LLLVLFADDLFEFFEPTELMFLPQAAPSSAGQSNTMAAKYPRLKSRECFKAKLLKVE